VSAAALNQPLKTALIFSRGVFGALSGSAVTGTASAANAG
jgi:hypothetical protein